jgi:hypothetical protein
MSQTNINYRDFIFLYLRLMKINYDFILHVTNVFQKAICTLSRYILFLQPIPVAARSKA